MLGAAVSVRARIALVGSTLAGDDLRTTSAALRDTAQEMWMPTVAEMTTPLGSAQDHVSLPEVLG